MGLHERGYEVVWASSNKIPKVAQVLINRGWAEVVGHLRPHENVHGKYMWTLKATRSGKSEYTKAQNQRELKFLERQVSLFNPRRRR